MKKTRRNLPHWEADGARYFITWRTKDAAALDPDERDIVLKCIKHYHNVRYHVGVAVVMPDHVHLILTPLKRADGDCWPLGQIIKGMKGVSAREINRRRNRRGAFWLDERFDRIPRGDLELKEKADYIRRNPIKHGLCARPGEYPWLWHGPAP